MAGKISVSHTRTPIPETLQLGNIELQTPKQVSASKRIAGIIWGPPGGGKTTFAMTAPGRKLLINIDPDGYAAIAHRSDYVLADLAGLDNREFFNQMQSENPLQLDRFLQDNRDVETVIVDSVTAIRDRAIHHAVDKGVGASKKDGFSPTIEAPGVAAYGARNAISLECVSGVLRVTSKYGVHCLFTAHEDDPERDGQGVIQYITMSLGGKMLNGVAYRLSEIWYLSQSDTGSKSRRLAVRPTRLRRPMKTRMFQDRDAAEFDLTFDADMPDADQQSMTIAGWYNEWVTAGHKIPFPESVTHTGKKKR